MTGTTMNYMGGKRNSIIAKARKKPNELDLARKRKAQVKLDNARARASSSSNCSEWEFSHARRAGTPVSSSSSSNYQAFFSETSATSKPSSSSSKISMEARKRALLNSKDWMSGGLSKSSPQSFQSVHKPIEETEPISQTRSIASVTSIRSPPRKKAPASRFQEASNDDIRSFSSDGEDDNLDISSLISDPYSSGLPSKPESHSQISNGSTGTLMSDIIMEDAPPVVLSFLPPPYCYYRHISEIQSEPLKLSFFHPCMGQDLGFPAVYERVEPKTGLERHKLEWPGCLKQMWDSA